MTRADRADLGTFLLRILHVTIQVSWQEFSSLLSQGLAAMKSRGFEHACLLSYVTLIQTCDFRGDAAQYCSNIIEQALYVGSEVNRRHCMQILA